MEEQTAWVKLQVAQNGAKKEKEPNDQLAKTDADVQMERLFLEI